MNLSAHGNSFTLVQSNLRSFKFQIISYGVDAYDITPPSWWWRKCQISDFRLSKGVKAFGKLCVPLGKFWLRPWINITLVYQCEHRFFVLGEVVVWATSLYCLSVWSLTRAYSRKRVTLVSNTFFKFVRWSLRELRLCNNNQTTIYNFWKCLSKGWEEVNCLLIKLLVFYILQMTPQMVKGKLPSAHQPTRL